MILIQTELEQIFKLKYPHTINFFTALSMFFFRSNKIRYHNISDCLAD